MTLQQAETADTRIPIWLGFALMCLGMFMAILDVQVVATSLPTMQEALGISPDAMSWIQTSYLIAEIIAIPLTGWLTRVLTLRWSFAVGISVFTLASIGCAFSGSFAPLIVFRVLQGFSGGTLIPAVFSAVFLLFPLRLHPIATTMAGIMAVLAPTVGPLVGGWITDTYTWHWLFLINVVPGIIVATATPFLLPRDNFRLSDLRKIDGLSVILMSIALASMEIGLKEAPRHGWLSLLCVTLFLLSFLAAMMFAVRTLKTAHPVVDLTALRIPAFAVSCALSFCLGVALFGSVYLMPVFLAYVRHHDAFEIGTVMLVTGAAQLATAPVAGAMESRFDPRWLSAAGFSLIALGLGWSAFQSRIADFDEMFWPQIVRGIAIMFCLLPPTRLALGSLKEAQVPDASALFNLMRNLGGAIGIALIDTILFGRTPEHAEMLRQRLISGDITAAQAIGLDLDLFAHPPPDVSQATIEAYVRPMVERAAFALSVNEAWALLTGIALFGLALIPLAGWPWKARTTQHVLGQNNSHL